MPGGFGGAIGVAVFGSVKVQTADPGATVQDAWVGAKVAVRVVFPFMVMLTGLAVPVAAPLQPVKV